MKKFLIFACSLLAVVACDSLYGGTDDSTPVVPGPDVNIIFSDTADDAFTVTIEPAGEATYYGYLVSSEDISDEIDPDVLYIGGYEDMAEGMVYWPDQQSVTLTFDGLHDSRSFYIYAVAGSVEGTTGEVAVATYSTPVTYEYVGTGTYYYSGFAFEGYEEGLELWRSINNPNEYRIENWFAGMSELHFTMDSDNVITVSDGTTGWESSYGEVVIEDLMADSYGYGFAELAEEGLIPYGHYTDGVYYFAILYDSPAGWFGFGYEEFVLDGYTAGPSLEDAIGTFECVECSEAAGYWYEGYEYTLAESDNASKGNIMFTVWDGSSCSTGKIYGWYDEETGAAEFETEQKAYTSRSGMTTYYVGIRLYYSDYYGYGYPLTFLFFKDGGFWGPFYGDYIEEGAYSYNSRTGYSYQGYFDVMSYLYCAPEGTLPSSVAPASAGLGSRSEMEIVADRQFSTDKIRLDRNEKPSLRK